MVLGPSCEIKRDTSWLIFYLNFINLFENSKIGKIGLFLDVTIMVNVINGRRGSNWSLIYTSQVNLSWINYQDLATNP